MRRLAAVLCYTLLVTAVPAAEEDLFTSFTKTVASRNSLHCQLTSTQTVTVKGKTEITTSSAKLWLKRPRMLLMVAEGPGYGMLSCSNGTSRTVFRPALNRYLIEKLPTVENAHLQPNQFGSIIADLLDADPATPALHPHPDAASPTRYVAHSGPQEHQFTFSGPSSHLAAYTATTTSPAQRTEIVFKWDLALNLDDKTFAFQPPPTARRVQTADELTKLDTTTTSLAVGSAVPDLAFETLSSGTVQLRSLRGRTIVLDFWATWCHGCPAALAGLKQIQDEYRHTSVTVFAINAREDKALVENFLRSNNITGLNIGLDPASTVTSALGVRKVPQSIIITAEGKIQSIQIGHGPETEKAIRSELDKLTKPR